MSKVEELAFGSLKFVGSVLFMESMGSLSWSRSVSSSGSRFYEDTFVNRRNLLVVSRGRLTFSSETLVGVCQGSLGGQETEKREGSEVDLHLGAKEAQQRCDL